MTEQPDRFTVVLKDTGHEAPTVRRLARVLKGLGRAHGFVCLKIFPGDRLRLASDQADSPEEVSSCPE